ncbi:MAG: phosphoadenylyl-sulfate reductase [Patulibacter sp.]|nr:phosphoadenylyl-sulfate reductase [Patulibacter sp.]
MTTTTNIPPAAPSLPDLEDSSAGDVVAWALAEYHPSIALACSFQKEESVLLDLLFRANPDARVFALDTGLLFDETYELWRQTEARYDTKIERWQGPTLAEQAKQHGDQLWATNPSQCCGIRKVAPLREGLSHLNAWITGIRRDQSPARAGAAKVEWDDAFGLVKVNPLADWSDKDVWRYVVEHDLPYNPLHDQGFSSIGCTPCTNPGEGRAGRWTGTGKVECGLHLEDA